MPRAAINHDDINHIRARQDLGALKLAFGRIMLLDKSRRWRCRELVSRIGYRTFQFLRLILPAAAGILPRKRPCALSSSGE
jgi:hypothetical protein